MRTSIFFSLLTTAILAVQALPLPVPDIQALGTAESLSRRSVADEISNIYARDLEILEKRGKYTKADAPDTLTITLGGTAYSLQKAFDAGVSIVYRVTAPASAVGDYAKTNLASKEVEYTTAVGLAVASGTDTTTGGRGADWLVIKQVHGKKLTDTAAYKTAKAAGKAKCQEMVLGALNLLKKEMKKVHAATGINHNDAKEDNCLFNDTATEVKLIDYGAANKEPLPASFTDYLKGQFDPKSLCP